MGIFCQRKCPSSLSWNNSSGNRNNIQNLSCCFFEEGYEILEEFGSWAVNTSDDTSVVLLLLCLERDSSSRFLSASLCRRLNSHVYFTWQERRKKKRIPYMIKWYDMGCNSTPRDPETPFYCKTLSCVTTEQSAASLSHRRWRKKKGKGCEERRDRRRGREKRGQKSDPETGETKY